MNRHVGKYIPENHTKTTYAGCLLIELLNKGDYVLVNSLPIATNGPLTRYDSNNPSNDDKKSAIDFIIVSKSLETYIEKFEIDKNLNWTPHRESKMKIKHSDHYALLLVLDNVPKRKREFFPTRKHTIWNTKKPNGWTKYRERTENNDELLRAAEMSPDTDPEKVLSVINREMKKSKYAAFGKVKISNKNEDDKKLESLQKEKMKIIGKEPNANADNNEDINNINDEMKNVIKMIQTKQYERDIEHLSDVKKRKGKAAAVFDLRSKILGNKKNRARTSGIN